MKLTIPERIVFISLLPRVASFAVIEAVQKFRPTLYFTEEETRRYDISSETTREGLTQVTFNKEVAEGYTCDVKIPAIIAGEVVKALMKIDGEELGNEQQLSLYQKFVMQSPPAEDSDPGPLELSNSAKTRNKKG